MQGETYIVILGEAEELADLGGTLGTQALGVNDVGQAGDIGLALLDDAESEDGEVHADDAATDGLSLALAGASGAVAGVAVGEEEADTGRVHDTLLHGETLLVVTAGDAEDVALELVTDGITRDLSAHLTLLAFLLSLFVFVTLVRKGNIRIVFEDGFFGFERTRFSMKTRSFRSSSMSMSFWLPLAG